MQTSHAIFCGLAMIALAIGAAGASGQVGAAPETQNYGHYAVAAGGNFFAVLDTMTGEVRICSLKGACQPIPGK